MDGDVEMQDADAVNEEHMQYGHGTLTEEEMELKYPNRPHNVHKTLLFHELFTILFNPLNEHRKKPTGPPVSRKSGRINMTPHEARRNIIERFIGRWRKQVGDDIYPAFRLIVPEKDRDRAMYGLKEKMIGKLLVRIMGIDKNSEDAFNLMNWKLPGQKASGTAGDFAGRCYEVLSKRPMRTKVGNMTIAEVNEMLDKLSISSKEEDQLPIFEQFYRQMNPEELMWLIRMILREMKIGSSERTFFEIWHPDAEKLFNISSSLRRVCWELYDPAIRLDGEKCEISLMQCFQPQLAAFQMNSFEIMVNKMKPTETDPEFWIEEKLDGERMQMHMVEDESVPGGMRFGYWSRKAKDYTYLYGNGFEDPDSALTQHLKKAFNSSVRNIILDGEMITWDMEQDATVPFGTLKTAALNEQRNPYSGGKRPLYRVFDCLYLNDRAITGYTLRDRRKALAAAVVSVDRRLEIHDYSIGLSASDIEPLLRKVVAEASEGLVIKSPRSAYCLNQRNDDWIKVKPEYMTEFGEALDCVVIGGYYGSGHRGGMLSSFLCGLRVDENQIRLGANPQKCYSFFKVGGGLSAGDYAIIKHRTEGKWIDWDSKNPPTEYVELGGGNQQFEKPDVWIKPEDSVVLEVKAASVSGTSQFRTGFTLRFPRFKKLRDDKSWREALSIQEFLELKVEAETKKNENAFEVDDERKKRRATTRPKKKALVVVGGEQEVQKPYAGPDTKVFAGLNFYIITDALKPFKKSKVELEQIVKANGGSIVQSQTAKPNIVCVADKELVRVRSIKKEGKMSVVRPSWLFDCIDQAAIDVGRETFLLPMEPDHMYHIIDEDREVIERNVDEFGDSYCRDVTVAGLKQVLDDMPSKTEETIDHTLLLRQFLEHRIDFHQTPGLMFRGSVVYFDKKQTQAINQFNGNASIEGLGGDYDLDTKLAAHIVTFAGGRASDDLNELDVTHVVVGENRERLREVRQQISLKSRIPRIVTLDWIRESWKERTLLDEERFAP